MEKLNKQAILYLIGHELQNLIQLEIHEEINSTNSHLLIQPLEEKIKVCFAESQTDGRGRHGKQWHSPYASNIYVSFAHRLQMDISALSGLSLVIGIALTETLQQYCKKSIGVKWPNDLLVDGKKLSGILIELKSENNGFCKVVTGLGINVEMPEAATAIINQPYINLKECNPVKELSRNELAADIVKNIIACIRNFEKSGFAAYYQKWNCLDAWYEQQIELEVGNKRIKGIHRGIDQTGALVMEIDGELTSWTSGEVRLRSAEKCSY